MSDKERLYELLARKSERQQLPRLGYGISEAAESIGCSPGHVRNLIARGELRSVKVGRRRIVPDEDLRGLLAQKSEERAA